MMKVSVSPELIEKVCTIDEKINAVQVVDGVFLGSKLVDVIPERDAHGDIVNVALYFYDPNEVDAGTSKAMPKEKVIKVKMIDHTDIEKDGE
jgi:hypothetical protein